MNSTAHRSVLIVEDDPNWRDVYTEDCEEYGWKCNTVDNLPAALRLIETGDSMFDIAIVDKGGSNALRGGVDVIKHRDGLTLLRRLKELQPFCIRVLSTGESWSREIFVDPTLGLHIFMDKAYYLENRDGMFRKLNSWHGTPDLEQPVLFTSPSRRERLL